MRLNEANCRIGQMSARVPWAMVLGESARLGVTRQGGEMGHRSTAAARSPKLRPLSARAGPIVIGTRSVVGTGLTSQPESDSLSSFYFGASKNEDNESQG